MKSIYLIGSLRNPNVPILAAKLRKAGYEIFDDWFAAGPEADDYWRDYEKQKGVTYKEALNGYSARHVFEFDRSHLDRCDAGVLLMPAGKSGHLELGYMAGKGKPTFVVFDEEPARWDVMYGFVTDVFMSMDEAVNELKVAATGANNQFDLYDLMGEAA